MIGLNGGLIGAVKSPSQSSAIGVWTLNEQINIRRQGLWPVAGDEFFANVSLLLHCDGTNGSTTIVDSSGSPKTVTAVGNAQISTAQSNLFGGGSLLLDGNGDYLSVNSSSAFDFGTNSFTVEAWVRLTSISGDFFIASASGNNGLFFGYNLSNNNGWGWGRAGVAWDYTSGITATTGTWYHLALCRDGTSMRLFVDGTQAGTTQTNSTSYNLSQTSLTIGSQGAGFYLNGYLDEVRITKGVARYTSNFVAPTAPFPG